MVAEHLEAVIVEEEINGKTVIYPACPYNRGVEVKSISTKGGRKYGFVDGYKTYKCTLEQCKVCGWNTENGVAERRLQKLKERK